MLEAPFRGHLRAGGLDDLLGVGDGVQDDRARRVEDACAGFGAAHAVQALRRKDHGGAVGAHDLDHPGHSFAVSDRRELVNDQQDATSVGIAAGEVLLEVLDEQPRELAGLLGIQQLVEEDVDAVGVLERPRAVELAGGCVAERAITLAAGVDVLVAPTPPPRTTSTSWRRGWRPRRSRLAAVNAWSRARCSAGT